MKANADAAEVAKFQALASRWWDPESEFRPLHQINPLRLDWIERLAGPLTGRKAVDVGCGGGILAAEQPSQFDVVTCMEMLEHVPDPESTIAACARLAKPGGWVFFSTLNRNPKSFLFAIIGAEYILNLLPRGTHEYEKFIKPSELVNAARRAGLEQAAMTGLTYNPISREYRLVDNDVSVNYLVATRRAA